MLIFKNHETRLKVNEVCTCTCDPAYCVDLKDGLPPQVQAASSPAEVKGRMHSVLCPQISSATKCDDPFGDTVKDYFDGTPTGPDQGQKLIINHYKENPSTLVKDVCQCTCAANALSGTGAFGDSAVKVPNENSDCETWSTFLAILLPSVLILLIIIGWLAKKNYVLEHNAKLKKETSGKESYNFNDDNYEYSEDAACSPGNHFSEDVEAGNKHRKPEGNKTKLGEGINDNVSVGGFVVRKSTDNGSDSEVAFE